MARDWDVIVVGARCAGATLAALLAQRGVRTLLLESSARGSDMPMSTHFVQPPGMDVLDDLGIGARVRAVTPASPRFRFALDESVAISEPAVGRVGYCVRRATLDPWLQDAAQASGAVLLDHHKVEGLLRDGDRVTGVVARTPSGTVSFRADLVVGADGVHSTIAKLVAAREYLVSEGSRAGYWAYFQAPERWEQDWDATLEHQGNALRYAFRCDGGVVVLVYAGERDEVSGWGRAYREKFRDALLGSPTTAALSAGKEPVGKVLGMLKMRFFYREPVGPGYALIGDAGHFKDFVTGQGMTDAFLDAQRLARAILDGRREAYEHFWRERDVATLPLHFDAIRQGEVGFNEPFMRWVIRCSAAREELKARLQLVIDRKIEPREFVSTPTLLRFVGSALVRGRFDVLPGFLRAGKALAAQEKVLLERKALLEQARTALARSAPEQARRLEAGPAPAAHA